MKDAHLCYYDAELNCWIKKEDNTRWQIKRLDPQRVGVAHEVYTEKLHVPYITLYVNPNSLPVFIKEDTCVDYVLNANDTIWGNTLGTDGKSVLYRSKTELFWVLDKDIEPISFSMTFDLNQPGNLEIREEVNIMLRNYEIFRVRDGSIRISLDQLTLTGTPDQLQHHFSNIASYGELDRPSELRCRFQEEYDKWIADGYKG